MHVHYTCRQDQELGYFDNQRARTSRAKIPRDEFKVNHKDVWPVFTPINSMARYRHCRALLWRRRGGGGGRRSVTHGGC